MRVLLLSWNVWVVIPALLILHYPCPCDAFLTGPPGNFRGNGGINNKPPHASHPQQSDWGTPDDADPNPLLAWKVEEPQNATDVSIRGGASKQSNNVVKGTKSTWATTTAFWSNAFSKAGHTITAPFRAAKKAVSSAMESEESKAEKELLEQLKTTKVQAVVLPNTTVVPKEVVQLAARRSGLIGNPLRTDRVQEFAASLKRWYQMRGYVLHSVTGATLRTETATAEIQVQEPQVSHQPVDITFCKEMVVDEETGNLLTFRQYKERHSKRRSFRHKAITKADTNTTFVQTNGKTRPHRIATALGLRPGRPFQWNSEKWNMVARSGIFGRILQAAPQRMRDGTVQLQILATEAPPRHLEYGVSKSLYTGSWEGEIDFQHENLLGGGESLGLMVRRGTKDPEPSVRLRYSDDKFGMAGGYDVEAFTDFIGDHLTETEDNKNPKQATKSAPESNDPGKMLDRKGLKFTLRNPIDVKKIQFSTVSTSVERTTTRAGVRENIGCGTLSLGPFRRQLPLDARSSVDGSLTTGIRVPERSSAAEADSSGSASTSYQGLTLLPYSSFTVTTTQVLPLLASAPSKSGRATSLALRHSLSGSTHNMPRHEQNAMGFSSMIRGGDPHGRISTYVTGSTELRVPLQLNVENAAVQSFQQDATVVLFGDWVSAQRNNGSPFFFEKSIGVGVRKGMQGIPLKLDFSYAGNGKIKSSFGLGRDFDV